VRRGRPGNGAQDWRGIGREDTPDDARRRRRPWPVSGGSQRSLSRPRRPRVRRPAPRDLTRDGDGDRDRRPRSRPAAPSGIRAMPEPCGLVPPLPPRAPRGPFRERQSMGQISLLMGSTARPCDPPTKARPRPSAPRFSSSRSHPLTRPSLWRWPTLPRSAVGLPGLPRLPGLPGLRGVDHERGEDGHQRWRHFACVSSETAVCRRSPFATCPTTPGWSSPLAPRAGRSLQEYLRWELIELASRPDSSVATVA